MVAPRCSTTCSQARCHPDLEIEQRTGRLGPYQGIANLRGDRLRVTCVLFRGQLNPVPRCRRPVRGNDLFGILGIGEPLLGDVTGS